MIGIQDKPINSNRSSVRLLSQLHAACRDLDWQPESESSAAAVIHRQTQVHLIVMQMTGWDSAAADPLLFLSARRNRIEWSAVCVHFKIFYSWPFFYVVLPLLWFRLKYLNNWMIYHEMWSRHLKLIQITSSQCIEIKSKILYKCCWGRLGHWQGPRVTTQTPTMSPAHW